MCQKAYHCGYVCSDLGDGFFERHVNVDLGRGERESTRLLLLGYFQEFLEGSAGFATNVMGLMLTVNALGLFFDSVMVLLLIVLVAGV